MLAHGRNNDAINQESCANDGVYTENNICCQSADKHCLSASAW